MAIVWGPSHACDAMQPSLHACSPLPHSHSRLPIPFAAALPALLQAELVATAASILSRAERPLAM